MMIDVILKGGQGDMGRMIDRLVMSDTDNAPVPGLTAAGCQKGREQEDYQKKKNARQMPGMVQMLHG